MNKRLVKFSCSNEESSLTKLLLAYINCIGSFKELIPNRLFSLIFPVFCHGSSENTKTMLSLMRSIDNDRKGGDAR